MVFPGPAVLGRGLVIEPGGDVPAVAQGWPRHRVDEGVLAAPRQLVDELDRLWRSRTPSIVELAVPLAEVKQPETCDLEPYRLAPSFSFDRERLHFLIWANRYDGRTSEPRWHHSLRAERLGADPDSDGTTMWIDGGPRNMSVAAGLDLPIVHSNQLTAGSLAPDEQPIDGETTDLAPDQRSAVIHPGGPARILAPAGSGKTRVLTARLRHLLNEREYAASTVTALAYNTRAAEEMRSRTQDLAHLTQPTHPAAGAQVRTLHSLGYEIIGRSRGGRPRLLDEREVRSTLERLLQVRPRANDDVYAPYLEALTQVRTGLWSPDDVEDDREDVEGFAEAFDTYRELLDERGAIDFDEQIYQAIEVLLRDPDTRRWAQGLCMHLLVDELQDLTPAHLLMIRLLAAPAYDVFGVGDDDQVIYGYAGATPQFLLDYADYFPGASSYLLEVNYRCPPDIVDAAAKLLSYNHQRVPKEVRAAAGDNGASGLTVEPHDEDSIGARLVEVVEERLQAGSEPNHVAVLTRVNAGLLVPQVLLADADIPIAATVDERMLDRTGMRAALSWLRLAVAAADRQLLDGKDLAATVRRPSRSLSPGIVKALSRGEWSLARMGGFANDLDQARLRDNLKSFHDDINELGRAVRDGATTAAVLEEVRDVIGLGGSLGRLDTSRSSTGGGHTDDLDAVILLAHVHPDPRDFEIWLRRQLKHSKQGSVGHASGVTLSTVHRVKGLEWPHVVVWDVSQGMMPHRLCTGTAEREEERRVFHVALTRAQQSSVVLTRKGNESPFLAELSGTSPRPQPRQPREPRRSGPGFGHSSAQSQGQNDPREGVEALREWRRKRAKDDGVPAFVILHDRHLEAVARQAPKTLDELLACDGIGPTKLERYGDDILAALNGD